MKEEKTLKDLEMEIKKKAVHGFQIHDSAILEAWADPVWYVGTYCNERSSVISDEKRWQLKTLAGIEKIGHFKITANPKKITCSLCKAKIARDIEKLDEDAVTEFLTDYELGSNFLDLLNFENFRRKLNSCEFCVFTASNSSSLGYLDEFNVKDHAENVEAYIRKIEELKDAIINNVFQALQKINKVNERYKKYLESLR